MSKKPKFTPGPWTVEVEEYEARSGQIIIPEINRLLHDPDWADPKDWDRDLANARLIAASPEMYEACWAALDYACRGVGSAPAGGIQHRLTQQLIAALKKADGEA